MIVIYGSANGLTATDSAVPDSWFWSQNSPGVPDSSQADDNFGAAVAAGDFNDDGFSDLAIGAPGERLVEGRTFRLGPAGSVTVIFGSAVGLTTSPDVGVPLPQILAFGDVEQLFGVDYGVPLGGTSDADFPSGHSFGSVLACGDFDGDGVDDLAIGSPEQGLGIGFGAIPGAGAVAVFPGVGGVGLAPDGSQAWCQDTPGIRDSSEANDHFGWALAAGDFDGDTRTDLAVGIPDEDDVDGVENAGAVATLFGAASGLTANSDRFEDQSFYLVHNLLIPGEPSWNDRVGGRWPRQTSTAMAAASSRSARRIETCAVS